MPGEESLAMQYETILVDVADHIVTVTITEHRRETGGGWMG